MEGTFVKSEKSFGVAENIRQSLVVMKNEIKKFFSGKRMMVFTIILVAIVFVIAVAPYLVGGTAQPFMFVAVASMVVLMASTLFASISIVSEYEERTALIVFTRPISKFSIFTGKMLACLVVTIGFTFLYYIVAIVVGLLVDHSFSGDMMVSFGLASAYAFATTGIGMLVSALLKKASTSTIITFVILAVIFMALSLVLNAASVDTSWMLYDSAGSIENASSDYRDYTNEVLDEVMSLLSDPTTFLKENWQQILIDNGYNPIDFLTQVNLVWGLNAGTLDI
ncbi:MAG: ABC transporter permease subunit [Candidatus Methanomethylophilaceae archaeon]|nr:ABC transporter permease subunit [Candidatus Methanomethylophilaceae archaeon]